MKPIRILADAASVAEEAAKVIADQAHQAVSERGRFVMAVSGGRTPWQMLRSLAEHDLPWAAIHLAQVDERVAPDDDPDRNLYHIRQSLLNRVPLPAANVHAMPVELPDLAEAAGQYVNTLREVAGAPPVLDLVHLGLGTDGHTASLIPADPVLDVMDRDVAETGPYQNRRRLTLTFPILQRSRFILWLVTGEEKAEMLQRLLQSDSSIPAGRVHGGKELILADHTAT
jgi:6-phosphogluconolactonase